MYKPDVLRRVTLIAEAMEAKNPNIVWNNCFDSCDRAVYLHNKSYKSDQNSQTSGFQNAAESFIYQWNFWSAILRLVHYKFTFTLQKPQQ